MGRKILCEKCGSILNEDILKEKNSINTCLVCGASLGGDDSQETPEEELIDWYYYQIGRSSYCLNEKYVKDDEQMKLVYTFQAPPRDENGSSERAKEVLRKKYPDAFAPANPNDIRYKSPGQLIKEGHCPRCGSTQIQLVPRKWTPLMGFKTNAVDRICVNCKNKF